MKYRKKLVLFTLFAMNLVEQPAPEVIIEQGTLSGKISADGSFFEYVGIPYATSNSGTRFQAPQPPPSWKGVYKAVDEIYRCPQKTFMGVVGTEDCLKMNVYVPAMAKRPLPVMVYIHGGAFILGSGGKLMYGPEFLVKQDVILVTFNYRLGALGFLCLGIKEAPGNAGIKDQIAALRWVKKNIAAFGGDPDNVTLFGESAGGASASILLASEATSGLFNRVIAQSGSSLAHWAVTRRPVTVARHLAKKLGHNIEEPLELYKLLTEIPYEDIIASRVEIPDELFSEGQLMHLPCVEKSFPGIEPALTDLPYNLFVKNKKNIPVIYGSTSKEGFLIISMYDSDEPLEEMNKKYLFASDLAFPSSADAGMVDKIVKGFYFNNEKMTSKKMNITNFFTDYYFELPPILETELVSRKSSAPVYNYYFNYSGGRNGLKYMLGFSNEPGACHGDDLFYLFTSKIWPYPIKAKDREMIDWMTKMWTNFAKYGDPTPPAATDLPTKWVPSDQSNLRFLHIEDKLKMGSIPNPDNYKIWKGIYKKYRRRRL